MSPSEALGTCDSSWKPWAHNLTDQLVVWDRALFWSSVFLSVKLTKELKWVFEEILRSAFRGGCGLPAGPSYGGPELSSGTERTAPKCVLLSTGLGTRRLCPPHPLQSLSRGPLVSALLLASADTLGCTSIPELGGTGVAHVI